VAILCSKLAQESVHRMEVLRGVEPSVFDLSFEFAHLIYSRLVVERIHHCLQSFHPGCENSIEEGDGREVCNARECIQS